MPVTRSTSSYTSLKGVLSRNLNRHNSFSLNVTRGVLSSFKASQIRSTRNLSSHKSFHQEKRVVYARNQATDVLINLGTLLPGQTVLTDVALSDGFYNIEVRSSLNFWDETRSRISFPVEIESGIVKSINIPNIIDLSFIYLTSVKTRLSWIIPDSTFISGMKFGIWTSATSPVDVSGLPDFELLASTGVGSYFKDFTQTVDTYYAVAAFTTLDQGLESEVFVPWSLTPPNSPPDQYAYRS